MYIYIYICIYNIYTKKHIIVHIPFSSLGQKYHRNMRSRGVPFWSRGAELGPHAAVARRKVGVTSGGAAAVCGNESMISK